jgi:purine-nucleoside phosphorylase
VYAHVLGPSYETRAEYRMLRGFAVDCVGMSTVPEAVAARRLGIAVAAVSVVTNVARPDAPGRTDAEDVCREAAAAAEAVWAIINAVAAAGRPG